MLNRGGFDNPSPNTDPKKDVEPHVVSKEKEKGTTGPRITP